MPSSPFLAPKIPFSFFLAGSLIAGIALQAYAYSLSLLCSYIIGLGAYYFFQRSFLSVFLLILIGILGACVYYAQQTHTTFFATITQGKTYDVQATVTDLQNIDNHPWHQIITLSLHAMKKASGSSWIPYSETIVIYVTKKQFLKRGQIVRISALTFPKLKNAEYQAYLCKEGIAASLFSYHLSYEIIQESSWSLSAWLSNLRENLFNRLKNKFSPATGTLFSALFLGNKKMYKNYMQQYQQEFKYWGISHYLARSGLHLVILIFLIVNFLSLAPLPYFIKQLIITLMLFIYGFLSWSSVSFLRAFLTFVFYKTYDFLEIPVHFVHIFSLVCFFILVWNPYQLFFLDFQLSFGLTFALAWLNHIHTQHNLIIF